MINIKILKNNNGATYVFVIITVFIVLFQLALLMSITINSRSLTSEYGENINRKILAGSSIEKAVDMLNKTLAAADDEKKVYSSAEAYMKINSNIGKRFKSLDSVTYETRFNISLQHNSEDKKIYEVTVSIKYLSESFEVTSTVVETRNLATIKYTSKAKSSVKFDDTTQKLYIVSMNTFI